jgi:hypothetical protein
VLVIAAIVALWVLVLVFRGSRPDGDADGH